jgi:hypothetical protein
LHTQLHPLLSVFLALFSFWNTFPPDDCCIINSFHNVKYLRDVVLPNSGVPQLLWPASVVPTIESHIVSSIHNFAFVKDHVVELISKGYFWEQVLEPITEWLCIPQIEVFISFLLIVVSKAHFVKDECLVLVEARVHSLHETVNQVIPEIDCSFVS